MSRSVRVHQGLLGSFRVCQVYLGLSGSVKVRHGRSVSISFRSVSGQGQVRVMPGFCQTCVTFLVVFEAEIGFSVLFFISNGIWQFINTTYSYIISKLICLFGFPFFSSSKKQNNLTLFFTYISQEIILQPSF